MLDPESALCQGDSFLASKVLESRARRGALRDRRRGVAYGFGSRAADTTHDLFYRGREQRRSKGCGRSLRSSGSVRGFCTREYAEDTGQEADRNESPERCARAATDDFRPT